MGDRVRRNHTGKRSQLCCKTLISSCDDGNCFIPPVLVHQSTHYTQDLHYKIPHDWVVHHSPSRYMDCDRWHKYMAHFSSIFCSSTLNPQLLLYDFHSIHFDDGEFNILWSHHIQFFVLNSCDSVHDQTNNNGPKLKLNVFYGNTIMKWTRKHVTIKFTPARINGVPVERW